jgi:hypothetical protein
MKTETIRIRIDSEILSKVRTLAENEIRPLAKQIEYILRVGLYAIGNRYDDDIKLSLKEDK